MLPPVSVSSSSLAECSLVEGAAQPPREPIVVDDWLGEILVRQWAAQEGVDLSSPPGQRGAMTPCEAAAWAQVVRGRIEAVLQEWYVDEATVDPELLDGLMRAVTADLEAA